MRPPTSPWGSSCRPSPSSQVTCATPSIADNIWHFSTIWYIKYWKVSVYCLFIYVFECLCVQFFYLLSFSAKKILFKVIRFRELPIRAATLLSLSLIQYFTQYWSLKQLQKHRSCQMIDIKIHRKEILLYHTLFYKTPLASVDGRSFLISCVKKISTCNCEAVLLMFPKILSYPLLSNYDLQKSAFQKKLMCFWPHLKDN